MRDEKNRLRFRTDHSSLFTIPYRAISSFLFGAAEGFVGTREN